MSQCPRPEVMLCIKSHEVCVWLPILNLFKAISLPAGARRKCLQPSANQERLGSKIIVLQSDFAACLFNHFDRRVCLFQKCLAKLIGMIPCKYHVLDFQRFQSISLGQIRVRGGESNFAHARGTWHWMITGIRCYSVPVVAWVVTTVVVVLREIPRVVLCRCSHDHGKCRRLSEWTTRELFISVSEIDNKEPAVFSEDFDRHG